MSDSSEIDNALTAKLLNDGTLMAMVPDGVFFDVGGLSMSDVTRRPERFVIVSLVYEHDEQMFERRAFEDALYLVKVVAKSTSGANVKGAAARIDDLLDGGTLTIPGYTLMVIQREERIRVTEPDEADKSLFWFHRGGRYRVMASPS